jgi:hypothetical protein
MNFQINNQNRRGTRNWVVGGSGASNDGTPVSPRPSWAGSQNVFTGTCESWSLVHITPAVMTGTPSAGRLRVDRVHGRVSLFSAGGTICAGAVGLYVAELNATTTKWSVRNPAVEIDAQRDDYVFLEGFAIQFGVNADPSFPTDILIDLPLNLLIGAGEGLFMTVGCFGAATISVYPWLRTQIGPTA